MSSAYTEASNTHVQKKYPVILQLGLYYRYNEN